MNKLKNIIKVIASLVILTSTAFADQGLIDAFAKVNKDSKGAFGLNYLQGTGGRASVKSGGSPAGSFLFQAAYRNEVARLLEQQYGMYTGNLFTTNYYELMGEYVYGSAYGSHGLDHEGLLAQSSLAMVKADAMVKSWVLEKFYISKYPSTRLARGFSLRGIAGSEFEQVFAIYFFNFYMSSMKTDYQYLPAFLLAKNSPIVESSALAKSRNLISESYDYFAGIYSSNSNELKDLWKIRNAIHNQVSEKVIPMIDQYLSDNPWYEADGHTYLQKIRVLLVGYYNFNPADVINLANSIGYKSVANAAQMIADQGVNPQTLLNLSTVVADVKTSLFDNSIVHVSSKTKALALIVKSCDFINKEINRMDSISSIETLVTILNTIYSEGFLIKDNWTYFVSEVQGGSVDSGKELLGMSIEIGTETLVESFKGSYQQWTAVAPDDGMKKFVDDTVKASSLNTAAVSLNK